MIGHWSVRVVKTWILKDTKCCDAKQNITSEVLLSANIVCEGFLGPMISFTVKLHFSQKVSAYFEKSVDIIL